MTHQPFEQQPYDETPPVGGPQRKGWFARSWWWFLPLVIGGPLLLCCGICGGVAVFVFGAMKQSQPYAEAVAMAQNDTQLQATLGTPIEPDWWVVGSINYSGIGANQSGKAELIIPIYGPKGSGILNVRADMQNGQWAMLHNEFQNHSGAAAVDLLANANAPPATQKP